MIHFSGRAHPVIHIALLLLGVFSAFDETRLASPRELDTSYHQLLTRKRIMWLVLLISFVIQSSQELDCGMSMSTTSTTTKSELHWSPWTPCPPCGGSIQLRINSEGQTEERGCSTQPCSQPLWSPWSPCSSSCGPGSMTRITSENKVERKDCNLEQCHTKSKLKGKKTLN